MEVKVIGCSITWTNRPTSSYCLDDNILIDCGEGSLKNRSSVDVHLDNIEHIFITHLHSDHTGSLMNILYHLRTKAKWNENIKQLNIYGPVGIKKHIKNMMQLFMFDCKPFTFMKFVKIYEIKNFEKTYKVGDYEIKCFKLKHGKIQDIAYTFKKEDKSVGFSGDCTYTENLDKFVQNANYLFLECCGNYTNDRHLGVDKFKGYKEKYVNKKFLAIHCCEEVYNNFEKLGIELAQSGKKYEI